VGTVLGEVYVGWQTCPRSFRSMFEPPSSESIHPIRCFPERVVPGWLTFPKIPWPMFESGSVRGSIHLILHFPERAYRGRVREGLSGWGEYSYWFGEVSLVIIKLKVQVNENED